MVVVGAVLCVGVRAWLVVGVAVATAMTLRFLMGPMVVEQVHAAGDDFISWSLTQKVYGLQVADDVAIAPDGTRFDPRTLKVDEHGIARAVPSG